MYNAIYLENGELNCKDFPTLDAALQSTCYPNIQVLSIEEAPDEMPEALQDSYEKYLEFWMDRERDEANDSEVQSLR